MRNNTVIEINFQIPQTRWGNFTRNQALGISAALSALVVSVVQPPLGTVVEDAYQIVGPDITSQDILPYRDNPNKMQSDSPSLGSLEVINNYQELRDYIRDIFKVPEEELVEMYEKLDQIEIPRYLLLLTVNDIASLYDSDDGSFVQGFVEATKWLKWEDNLEILDIQGFQHVSPHDIIPIMHYSRYRQS